MTDIHEETSGATGMQQRHKEPRSRRAIISRKQDNTEQGLQEDCRAGGRVEISRNFHYTAKHEC
jgi:hypothetical protein